MRKFFIAMLMGMMTLSVASAKAPDESTDTKYSKPSSSFKPSTDVKYLSTEDKKTIEHVNVSVDDTTGNALAQVQEKAEWKMKNEITVLNNMGDSSDSKVYSAEELESKTGEPVEKKGVVEVAKGDDVRFTTEGHKVIRTKEDDKKAEPGSRVLVS